MAWGASTKGGRSGVCHGSALLTAAVGVVEVQTAEEQTLREVLQELRDQEFFSLFRMNLFAPCGQLCEPEELCDMRCAVEPLDDVSDWLRDKDEADFHYELDGWSRFDPPTEQAEYYSILQYPESDTGYDGSKVWKFIHSNLAFREGTEGCEALFNRALSAIHTCIAVSIVTDMREQGNEEGSTAQFARRVTARQSSVEDILATRALVLSAVQQATEVLRAYDFGDDTADILPFLEKVFASPLALPGDCAAPADVTAFRMRLRELCLVMDCVQCNACRMHGKINAMGLATALRILWSHGVLEGQEQLTRVEVACLVVFLEKLTTSLHRIATF